MGLLKRAFREHLCSLELSCSKYLLTLWVCSSLVCLLIFLFHYPCSPKGQVYLGSQVAHGKAASSVSHPATLYTLPCRNSHKNWVEFSGASSPKNSMYFPKCYDCTWHLVCRCSLHWEHWGISVCQQCAFLGFSQNLSVYFCLRVTVSFCSQVTEEKNGAIFIKEFSFKRCSEGGLAIW